MSENEKKDVVVDSDLDFNKKNRDDYENLMADSSTQLDGYWDRKNPFVIIVLLFLLGIIIFGNIFLVMGA